MTTEKQNKSNVIHPFRANVLFLQPLKAKITHIKIKIQLQQELTVTPQQYQYLYFRENKTVI